MALWLLISAAYPLFIIAMVIKAIRHYRRQRSFPTLWVGPKPTPAAYAPSLPERRRSEPPPGDWTPAR